ncbi:MAG: hypothetical protein IPJ47_12260 [Anaerolineales bacterium]|nr:hypothetical protein [Anaerolineales bacterium]
MAFDPANENHPSIQKFGEECLTCHLHAEPREGEALRVKRVARHVTPRASIILTTTIPYTQCNACHNRGNYDLRKMAEEGMTVVMVEHKVEWIAECADRVIALKEGLILMEGKPNEVLTSDLLTENGFGVSRYTSTAREAKKQGLWKKQNLPVTLDEAVEGFKK